MSAKQRSTMKNKKYYPVKFSFISLRFRRKVALKKQENICCSNENTQIRICKSSPHST